MELLFASCNQGKYEELVPEFDRQGISLLSMHETEIASPEETGKSFVENALIKARHAAEKVNMPVLADDSGLVVDALQGDPGVYSSRYAGDDATDLKNNAKLLQAMEGESHRFAFFVSVLVFLRHANDPVPLISEGRWEGKIMTKPQGRFGFGYDPIFWVPSHQCSAADLQGHEKFVISHRGKALRLMMLDIKSILTKECA